MNILEIYLAPRVKETFTIALVQLCSPFFDHVAKVRSDRGYAIAVTEKTEVKYRQRIQRLVNILNEIEKHCPEVDIVALPEYAFISADRGLALPDKTTLELCEEFSLRTGKILVGNYYDSQARNSVSFVCCPKKLLRDDAGTNGKIVTFTASKHTRTNYDDDFLKIPTDEKAEHSVIRLWSTTPSNEEGYVQIFTCKDYLYFTSVEPLRCWPDIIRLDKPGIIVVLLCSPDVGTFEARASMLMRDVNVKSGVKSLVTCLCNASATTEQSAHEKATPCGYTQVISPIDLRSEQKPVLRGGEGVVVACLNPFKAIAKPTPINDRESNAVMSSSTVFELGKKERGEWHLFEQPIAKKRHTGFVVNPAILHDLGFRKIYGFLRLDDYIGFKDLVKQRFDSFPELAIALHGVYGVHDAIAISWEECDHPNVAREVLKNRLWPMLRHDAQLEKDRLGCCIVDKFHKFHGHQVNKENGHHAARRHSGNESFRSEVRSLMLGATSTPARIEELKRDGVLIPTEFDTSDISDKERGDGKIEFLVLLRIVETANKLHGKGVKREFERFMLPLLIADDRIRTIEEISAERVAYVDADYILHVVGHLTDLNALIISTLHNVSELDGEIQFRCNSMVVIPAERLSAAKHPSLLEEPKITATEPTILAIMEKWKGFAVKEDTMLREIVPSSIHFIKEESLRQMLQSYFLADTIAQTYLERRAHWMEHFLEMLYGISIAIAGKQFNHVVEPNDLKRRSTAFAIELSTSVEKGLTSLFAYLCARCQISPQEFEYLVQECISVIKEQPQGVGKFSLQRIELGTAAFALEKLNGLHRDKFREALLKRLNDASTTGLPTPLTFKKAQNAIDQIIAIEKLGDAASEIKSCQKFAIG